MSAKLGQRMGRTAQLGCNKDLDLPEITMNTPLNTIVSDLALSESLLCGM